jgi:hypothetical protein
MADDAPDVSTDYSFLLESSVLDGNHSVSPGAEHMHFVVSRLDASASQVHAK